MDNECAQAGGLLFGEGEMLHNDPQNRMWELGKTVHFWVNSVKVVQAVSGKQLVLSSKGCLLSQPSPIKRPA